MGGWSTLNPKPHFPRKEPGRIAGSCQQLHLASGCWGLGAAAVGSTYHRSNYTELKPLAKIRILAVSEGLWEPKTISKYP